MVNQVLSRYNDFGQLTAQYQAHGGVVNTSTTPNVEYAYADGSANTIRPTSLTYPNGRVLTYSYGTTDGINDASSRIETLVDDDSTPLAEYEYLGLGSIVEVDYPQPDLRYRLFDPGLSGDIYTSLDRFGRVIDCHWYDYGSSASAAQIKYGYDRASNRIWREDPVAAANGKRFDELYAYDGLQRLKEMQRGTLNGGKDAITNLQFEQCWSLDATGNWSGFRSDDDGSGWSLVQQRTANEVNEITGISETTGPSWATPSYDPAGNMTTIPQPNDPTGTYAATYDAWNRLTKLTDGEDTVQENQYDARRFRIVRKDYVEGILDETRHFYYTAGWQSIEERLDSEADPDRQSVWGLRYIDDLVLRDRPDLEERLYGMQDGNWNMIAILDDSGDVQERYAYSPYGVPMFLSAAFVAQGSSSFAWETLYAGYRWDANSGLFCVRNRYLHPVLGTWVSRDPLSLTQKVILLYEYANSGPVVFLDPFGLQSIVAKGHEREEAHSSSLLLGDFYTIREYIWNVTLLENQKETVAEVTVNHCGLKNGNGVTNVTMSKKTGTFRSQDFETLSKDSTKTGAALGGISRESQSEASKKSGISFGESTEETDTLNYMVEVPPCSCTKFSVEQYYDQYDFSGRGTFIFSWAGAWFPSLFGNMTTSGSNVQNFKDKAIEKRWKNKWDILAVSGKCEEDNKCTFPKSE